MEINFFREVSPVMILTFLRPVPNCFDRNLTSSLLALPSVGGALRENLKVPSAIRPLKAVTGALGMTFTLKRTGEFSVQLLDNENRSRSIRPPAEVGPDQPA